jgi:transcriptional regulator with XRE-family HTH domain
LIPEEKIAAACRSLRAMKNLKQSELGERMGVTGQTVRAIESGRSNATRYVYKIIEATDVTLGEFDLIMDIHVNSERRSAR